MNSQGITNNYVEGINTIIKKIENRLININQKNVGLKNEQEYLSKLLMDLIENKNKLLKPKKPLYDTWYDHGS